MMSLKQLPHSQPLHRETFHPAVCIEVDTYRSDGILLRHLTGIFCYGDFVHVLATADRCLAQRRVRHNARAFFLHPEDLICILTCLSLFLAALFGFALLLCVKLLLAGELFSFFFAGELFFSAFLGTFFVS